MAEPYYLTTAINYPNGRPHIGHAYEAIAADVIARHQRARGRDVRFQTGTDEHGLKMARKAAELGQTPRQLADEMSDQFRALADRLDISYDRFIRTVEADHHRASAAIWNAMAASGDLYLDRYEGWYSPRDEAFYDESELTDDGAGGRISPQGTPVEWTAEESWFFRLSRYAEPLLDLYQRQPGFVAPAARRNEMIAFVKGGLRDLSISRTSFDWGVPVPGSPGHVMYVWVDALTNYLTGLGYPDEGSLMEQFWPAALHLVGKDIVRFHAVYWPAFLMSAGLPLPKQVFGHGFILNRGQKESKSLGNVTDPLELIERFGVDPLRYFLMREVSFGQDGNYSDEALVTRVNAELSNGYGNLVQRVLSFVAKHCDGLLAPDAPQLAEDAALLTLVRAEVRALLAEFDGMAFSTGLESWMRAVFACNAYVDAQAPWGLRKSDPARMQRVLFTLVVAIRELAEAIAPVIPRSAAAVLDMIEPTGDVGGEPQTIRIASPRIIFPRLEARQESAPQ